MTATQQETGVTDVNWHTGLPAPPHLYVLLADGRRLRALNAHAHGFPGRYPGTFWLAGTGVEVGEGQAVIVRHDEEDALLAPLPPQVERQVLHELHRLQRHGQERLASCGVEDQLQARLTFLPHARQEQRHGPVLVVHVDGHDPQPILRDGLASHHDRPLAVPGGRPRRTPGRRCLEATTPFPGTMAEGGLSGPGGIITPGKSVMAKKRPKQWVFSPPRPPKPSVSKAVKAEVEAKARAFIEAELKPRHVESPPPKDARFNYLADITCKWHGPYFYLVGVFACPGPHALSPTFEDKLARLLYAGPDRFNLAFQRHTGQWVELFENQSLQECLEAIRDDPWFIPF
jgi:hypothetical protein